MSSNVERILSLMFDQIKSESQVEMDFNSVQKSFRSLLEVCYEANSSEGCVKWFSDAILAYLSSEKPRFCKIEDIQPLGLGQCPRLTNNELDLKDLEHIKQLAIIKLNGGLGTSMGCKGPKSLINVMQESSFIDIIKDQKYYLESLISESIPFYLMNSFNTHSYMVDYKHDFRMFQQHKIPRLLDGSLALPPLEGNDIWAPPGHGNIYLCLYEQGILQQLLDEGKEFLFISNADNLGATVDPQIMSYILDHDLDFLMEVTPKTLADVKGGALVKRNGRYDLLERAQVHLNDLASFEDISTFSYFNTNNIWVRIEALIEMVKTNKLQLPIMFNKKNVKGHSVIQCETAMGSALNIFERAACLHVERNRFFPVKKTSDLLLLRSNCMTKDKSGVIKKHSDRRLPLITLSKHYDDLHNFEARIPSVPDLSQCRSLTVKGDVTFGQQVIIKGDVTILAEQGKPHLIENQCIEDQSVHLNTM